MKKRTLTDQVADDYTKLCNKGRFTKKCVPRGYISDLDWTTIHDNPNQPIKPVKQEEDPTETTVTLADLQRLRDYQAAILDPKQSSNQPPSSRNNWNAIQHHWTHQNAIQPKWRLTKCKLTLRTKISCTMDTDSSWSHQGNFRTDMICHIEEKSTKCIKIQKAKKNGVHTVHGKPIALSLCFY